MKQTKIIPLIKANLLLVLLLAGFFNLGFVPKAFANCNYSVVNFDTAGDTSFSMGDTVKFNFTLQRTLAAANANQIDDCTKSFPKLRIYTDDVPHAFLAFNGNIKPADFDQAGRYTNTATFEIRNTATYKEALQNKTSLTFHISIHPYTVPGTEGKDSLTVNFSYSGTVTAPPVDGQDKLTLTLSTGTKELNKGDKFTLNVNMKATDVRTWPNGVKQIKINTYVNETNLVATNTVDRAWLQGSSLQGNATQVTQEITIQTPPFKEGPNNINTNYIDVGTGVILATGPARVSVAGVSSGPGNGGGGPPVDDGTGTPPIDDGQGTPPVDKKPCTDPNSCLYNPLPEDELTHVFLMITQGFLAVVGIWAVIFIIVGGFQMVAAAGNEEAILKAKKTITWAVLGVVIALLSFSIVAIVQNLLQTTIKPTDANAYKPPSEQRHT